MDRAAAGAARGAFRAADRAARVPVPRVRKRGGPRDAKRAEVVPPRGLHAVADARAVRADAGGRTGCRVRALLRTDRAGRAVRPRGLLVHRAGRPGHSVHGQCGRCLDPRGPAGPAARRGAPARMVVRAARMGRGHGHRLHAGAHRGRVPGASRRARRLRRDVEGRRRRGIACGKPCGRRVRPSRRRPDARAVRRRPADAPARRVPRSAPQRGPLGRALRPEMGRPRGRDPRHRLPLRARRLRLPARPSPGDMPPGTLSPLGDGWWQGMVWQD